MKDKRFHRKRLIVFLSVCAAALAFIAVALVILFNEDAPRKPYVPPRYQGSFSPVNPSEDITLDTLYMTEYDRTVRYEDESGVTYELTDADHDDGGSAAAFIYEVLSSIRNGDSVGYNAALSDYYKDAIGVKPAFTPQKLYDIFIKRYSYEDGGKAGVLFAYQVSFKIKDNNGTFRDDVGSDMMRRITYYLRQTVDGWEIYTITYLDLNIKE